MLVCFMWKKEPVVDKGNEAPTAIFHSTYSSMLARLFILFHMHMSDQVMPWESKLQTNGKLVFATTYKIHTLYLLSSFRSVSTFFTSSSNDSILFLVDAVLVTVFILPLILLKTSTNSLFSFPVMFSIKVTQKISTRDGNVYLQNNVDVLFMSLK